MNVLSLFSGGGLGDYGLELAGMKIVGQCEIDSYCQKILKLRWPDVPKWEDVRDVKGEEVIEKIGRIDLVSGGFPCQDISTAGKGAGITGERSGLWKEMFRIICEVQPRFVLVENVSALLGRGLGVVLGDLAKIGYDTEWDCIPASAIGAPHQRDRIWIVARKIQHADNNGPHCSELRVINKNSSEKPARKKKMGKSLSASDVSNAQSKQNRRLFSTVFLSDFRASCGWWATEPNVGRVAHGVAGRVDRLKCLGNGQVVQVVQFIGQRIMEYSNEK